MTREPVASQRGSYDVQAAALPPAWRAAAALLKTLAQVSLLLTLAALLWSPMPPNNPMKLMRLFAALFAAPAAAAWCIERAFRVRLRIDDESLLIEEQGRSVAIPLSAIAALEPWRLPLPKPGLRLRLRSGRYYSSALLADVHALAAALLAAGADPSLREGLDGPLQRWQSARARYPSGLAEHPLLKFVVFPLVPTVPVFRLHQWITYGGTFGEYYTFGLRAYLTGFLVWWVWQALWLLYFAAAFRAAVEVLALAAAVVLPAQAVAARVWLERLQRLLYYAGIPAFLAIRLLA